MPLPSVTFFLARSFAFTGTSFPTLVGFRACGTEHEYENNSRTIIGEIRTKILVVLTNLLREDKNMFINYVIYAKKGLFYRVF